MPKIQGQPKNRICKQCHGIDVDISTLNRWPDWKIYKCRQCIMFWYVCKKHNQCFAQSKYSQMNNHFKMLHYQTIENIDSDHNPLFTSSSIVDNNHGLPLLNNNVTNVCSQVRTIQSYRFFLNEIQSKNNGVRGLIARAFQLNNHSPTNSVFYHTRNFV